MAGASTSVPAETDTLCEGCGYVLNGLPDHGRCPECGKPIAESAAALRLKPAWEARVAPSPGRFLSTSAAVIFRPRQFYRALSTRAEPSPSRRFAQIHVAIAALFFGTAAYCHFQWLMELGGRSSHISATKILAWTATVFVLMSAINWIAAKLTTWEARYWGFRLPLPVVRRGLDYHTAHYLPVAVLTWATIIGYAMLRQHRVLDALSDTKYLYVLCGEVVVGAIYLFRTYWIGMRNMMYANA